jgi:hypothetical protein
MISIDFPGATLKIGKKQADVYSVIHAMPMGGKEGEIIACFELSDEELAEVIKTKRIYYSRWTFGYPFQPMRLSATLEDGIELIPEK